MDEKSVQHYLHNPDETRLAVEKFDELLNSLFERVYYKCVENEGNVECSNEMLQNFANTIARSATMPVFLYVGHALDSFLNNEENKNAEKAIIIQQGDINRLKSELFVFADGLVSSVYEHKGEKYDLTESIRSMIKHAMSYNKPNNKSTRSVETSFSDNEFFQSDMREIREILWNLTIYKALDKLIDIVEKMIEGDEKIRTRVKKRAIGAEDFSVVLRSFVAERLVEDQVA